MHSVAIQGTELRGDYVTGKPFKTNIINYPDLEDRILGVGDPQALGRGNKRNMDLIKGNAAAIAKVDKAVGELDGTVAELSAGFGRHESAFARQEQMVDQITTLGAQLQQVQRALRDAIDRSNAAQQSVASLNSGLAKRVTETEQAVQAFDAYRLQTNARIADIERRIGAPPL